jgi:hypothetical protein
MDTYGNVVTVSVGSAWAATHATGDTKTEKLTLRRWVKGKPESRESLGSEPAFNDHNERNEGDKGFKGEGFDPAKK